MDGEASISLSNLGAGLYNVRVVYAEGNYTYEQDGYITIFDMNFSFENNANLTILEMLEVKFSTGVQGNLNISIDGSFINQFELYGWDSQSFYLYYSTEGTHTLNATYINYDGTVVYSKESTFNILPIVIDIPKNITKNSGGNHYATVKVMNDVTGEVNVYVDGEKYGNPYYVYGSQENIWLNDLNPGTYEITIVYSGNYPETSKTETVTVSYTAQLEQNTYYLNYNNPVTAVLPYDINKENVIVKIGGNVHDWTNEGYFIYINRADMSMGKHNITVEYSSDGENFTTVIDDEFYIISYIELNWGNYIVLVLPQNATGKLLINISEYDQETYEFNDIISEDVSFKDGKAIYYLGKLRAGVYYNIHAKYDGDDYQIQEMSTSCSFDEIIAIDKQVLYSNESVTVSYSTVNNYGGDFIINLYYDGSLVNSTTVSLDENNYTEYIFSNLKYGKYQFELMYGYGGKWYDVEVLPLDSSLNINVSDIDEDETAKVNVTLPEDATGNITVLVDGVEKYSGYIKNVELENLTAGAHAVEVKYSGDDKYAPTNAVKAFIVTEVILEPVDSEANITIPSNVNADETPKVDVQLPEDATGNITVLVDGKKIDMFAANKTVNIPLNDLTAGNHNVEVIYSGDDKYAPASETKEITVSKVTTTITAQAKEITEGETLIITVNINTENTKTILRLLKAQANTVSKATGIILVKINDDKYYADVINGVATVTINNLKAGKYDADITYLGDDKYNVSTTIAPIIVKAVETPAKEDANVSVDVPSSFESGETPVVSVSLPEDATGNVSVLVDGKEVASVPIVNGSASVPLDNLSNGAHVVEVKYSGDDKYDAAESTSAIAVTKPAVTPEPVVKIEVNIGLTVPSEALTNETPTAIVTLPKDTTGNVSILVDGKQVANVSAKENINVLLNNLAAGAHLVEVKYSGDDNYDHASAAKAILISEPKVTPIPEPAKEDINVSVDVPSSAVYGEIPAVSVSLPEDATGNVSVLVDGKEVACIPVVNGTANIPLENLTAGAHLVEVKYSGDDKYASSNTPKAIVVSDKITPVPPKTKIDTILSANATLERVANEHTKTGENGTDYYVTLTDVNGNKLINKTVQIAINGVHYYVQTDEDGRAHQTVSMESANVYTYAFAFQGDDDYNAAPLNSTRLTVTKKATTITAKAISFKKSAKTKKVTVKFSTVKNADGNMYLAKGKQLTLKVNGKTYKAKTNVNNKAIFSIKLTKKGKFNAKIAFAGSKIYAACSKTIKITIK